MDIFADKRRHNLMEEVISNKKKNKKDQYNEMSFWQHLEELRWHLIRSFAAILIFAIAAFIFKTFIFEEIILAPGDASFITNRLFCQFSEFISIKALCINQIDYKIINLKLSGQFMTHMQVSIVAGIVVAFPYLIWELWRFIKPALMPKERKHSGGAVMVCSILFLLGVLFSYYIIVPLTLNFFGTYQVSESVKNSWDLSFYIKTVVSLTFAVGIVFELPVFIYFLTKVGIVTPGFLKKNRKTTIVLILLLSAIITPPDVFSQILVGIPLLALYELSIYIAKGVEKKKQIA